jgi:gluconolactonase
MTALEPEVLTGAIGHAEGPTVLADGRCVFCECYDGSLGVWHPDGRRERYATLGGGPNGSVLGADGYVYVANNGGAVGPFRSHDFGPGSIQAVSPDGEVETVVKEVDGRPLNMPNDLVFGRDGRLYFTDPGRWDPDNRPDDGYVYAVAADGTAETIMEVGRSYPNGVTAEADGSIVWVESYTRRVRRWRPDGHIEEIHTFAEEHHVPDGLAVAENGDLYIATLSSGGFHILSPDGSGATLVDLGGTTLSNCVFEGEELYLTDLGSKAGATNDAVYVGRLLRLRLDVGGMPMFRGEVRPVTQVS